MNKLRWGDTLETGKLTFQTGICRNKPGSYCSFGSRFQCLSIRSRTSGFAPEFFALGAPRSEVALGAPRLERESSTEANSVQRSPTPRDTKLTNASPLVPPPRSAVRWDEPQYLTYVSVSIYVQVICSLMAAEFCQVLAPLLRSPRPAVNKMTFTIIRLSQLNA